MVEEGEREDKKRKKSNKFDKKLEKGNKIFWKIEVIYSHVNWFELI